MQQYIGTKVIQAEPENRGETHGYKVVYQDGYQSWSPAEVFEAAYRPSRAMTFGLAVEALKKGLKVARTGWNGKGMYLFLSPAVGCQAYEQFTGKPINDLQPFIVMKAADGTLVPWLASQADMLAEDWILVE